MFTKKYFSKDIFDFLVVLSKHNVKFVIVGGEAVIYYGHARLTGDIDIYYELSANNITKLWNALLEFWDDDIPIIKSQNEFNKSGVVVQFGLPPNRIDLINVIEGVDFNEVWENKTIEILDLGNGATLEIYLIGIKELIKNKEAAARFKDLEDLKFLKAIIKD
jgi:hypothetical protein